MQRSCLIAIDPGWKGGIAWRLNDRVFAVKMPDSEQGIFDVLAHIERQSLIEADGRKQAIIEFASSRSAQGVRSVWRFSANYNLCRMGMVALGIPFRHVMPRQWQGSFGLVGKMGSAKWNAMTAAERSAYKRVKKNRSKDLAQELFPDMRVTHMISEALLMLEYLGRQTKFRVR